MGTYASDGSDADATGMRFGIVAGRFNRAVSERLLEGVERVLSERGVAEANVTVAWVPGAFEIPLVAQRLAASGTVDAVICVGAVIRGDTAHFEYVAGPCADGVLRVALDTGIPVVFGVLTTENLEQATDRTGGREGHKGEEAALTAIEMVSLLGSLPGEGE
ncbi:MAG: 6,7-dimethyl-8-ribityllumazine synthase [Acidimicrobiia bacterium]|nr:6,7-dimethyl-8-ribityllumazine synthase [Acidimicrobiia bacterium]